jgi:hypothetical protein
VQLHPVAGSLDLAQISYAGWLKRPASRGSTSPYVSFAFIEV